MFKPKVVLISAHSRSGSTVLDRILAQVNGAFTVGELRHVWQRSFVENQLCGCGVSFNNCDIWRSVIKNACIDKEYAHRMVELNKKVDRFKRIPQIKHSTIRSRSIENAISEYIDGIYKIYASIQSTINPEFIIDSSKSPSYAMLLQNISNIDLRIVHLVRDSRAVAYSRLIKKHRPEIHWKNEYTRVTPAYKTALHWNLINRAIESLKDKSSLLQLRYEDVIKDPVTAVKDLLKFVDAGDIGVSHINGNIIELKPDHTVSGNPVRFKTGKVELECDNRWVGNLKMKDRKIVELLTSKQLKKYSYY
jgi:REP element-mobilizing transposase RayT